MASTNPARGMRDFLPADVRKREYVIGIIKQVYESYGFEPLETPAVENIETLMGKYGEEGNQLVFRILKRGEKLFEGLDWGNPELNYGDLPFMLRNHPETYLSDLALRYDLTVPLARVVADNKNELPKFFKRYQIQPVWRADRPARGRFREFYQCDVDWIGTKSPVVEAELIRAVSDVLEKLGFRDFVIRINDRRLLTDILNAAGIPTDKHNDALVAIDKIDKIGRSGVEKEFRARGIEDKTGTRLLAFLEYFLRDEPRTIFDESNRLELLKFVKDIEHADGLPIRVEIDEDSLVEDCDADSDPKVARLNIYVAEEDLPTIRKGLPVLQPTLKRHIQNALLLLHIDRFVNGENPSTDSPRPNIRRFHKLLTLAGSAPVKIDPTLARGLSYYTGTIMEINVPDLAGSLGGGGRYDGLIGMFGKEQIPACGFSLGLERILVVMEERGMFPPGIADSTPADVMVTIWSEETVTESLKLANDLRSAGLRVTLYPEADRLGKQLKYADSIKVPWVCVIGESELAENKVTIKNMRTGEQNTVERSEAADKIGPK